MPTFELEYTICQIQSGKFSMAAKSHRQEGGNPRLEITTLSNETLWRLTDLEHGVPETVAGQPRVNRIDFYFRLQEFRQIVAQFPAANSPSNPARRLAPRDSSDSVRPGGKWIRFGAPICRFARLPALEIWSQQPPSFRGDADNAILHLDFETGPAQIYGTDIPELHFGVEADSYDLSPLTTPTQSRVILHFDPELYATVLAELQYL